MKHIRVVAAIITNSHAEVCVAQRPTGSHLAGFWEFPGGKVEPQEAHFDALVRECQEELDIIVVAGKSICQNSHAYAEKIVELDFWHVTEFTGTPIGKEGQTVKWVSLAELHQLSFPPANQVVFPLLDRLLETC